MNVHEYNILVNVHLSFSNEHGIKESYGQEI